MKRVLVVTIVTALLIAAFPLVTKVAHAPSGGSVLTVGTTGMFPTLLLAVGFALPNDEIHVLPGHTEVVGIPIVIAVNNLWIVGGPSSMGPVPWIDLAGGWIQILSNNVYITGLDIVDTTGASPMGIELLPGTGGCTIQNNRILGTPAMGSIGIRVFNSASNIIAANTIIGWDIGIDVTGPGTAANLIKFNWIDISMMSPAAAGVRVGSGAIMNHVFWNTLIGLPAPPFSGLGQELWDSPMPNPPNIFDDGAQVPTWGKGNFESSWTIPPPYPVLGPGANGWLDLTPLVAPITPLTGDLDLNGQVDIFDAIKFAGNYGQFWCNLGWDPRIDLRIDGVVDLFDAILLAGNFNTNI